MNLSYELIAGRIDHALLLPTLTPAEVEAGCRTAEAYAVASVCVKPADVALAARVLDGSRVKVGTVIGFPHGGQATAVKQFEARTAIQDGAVELDMVINIGWARAGLWDDLAGEIRSIADLSHEAGAILKVIFENCYLDDDQKARLCGICGEVGADYVKTSTGFGSGGATEADLILMRAHSPAHVKLKAAGGMRDLDAAVRFIEIGCDRLGTSKTVEILDSLKERLGASGNDRPDVSRETKSAPIAPGQDY
ncbi:deoxyribose-phosphate aldolase [Tundrisphaera sp. TA3]|uniref:deoxyribose-phosphate aldolase n=1 Tax=Tundrisphaera sp. TA3 TaxID=3435775 RepID=UPI003EBBFAB2